MNFFTVINQSYNMNGLCTETKLLEVTVKILVYLLKKNVIIHDTQTRLNRNIDR